MSNELRDQWANLGIAFAADSRAKHADPEATLVRSLSQFHEDRKLLRLVVTWLNEFGHLVHVERLKSLAKNLDKIEYAWLGVLADHMSEDQGDTRFRTIRDLARKQMGEAPAFFEDASLHKLHYEKEITKPGNKPAGIAYGLRVSKSDLLGDSKKLSDLKGTTKGNLWLRMRLLFGSNWRADMATVMLLDMAANYYQARKILGCSIETAHRNWNSLKEANVTELLRV